MPEVLTVLTFKSVRHIVRDGGTQSWVISPHRASRCRYVVCVRHQQGPYKAEGNEPHKHAFLVGRVSGVVPSSETGDRFRVEMSEYAVVDGPQIPLNSASPTQYFPSLDNIGIDEASLQWTPISEMPSEYAGAAAALSAEDDHEDGDDGDDNTTISVLLQAKKLVADGLHLPMSAIEIVIRG